MPREERSDVVTTYVLVPGACHGGWWYEPLCARLAQHGHRGVPVTLTGPDPTGRRPTVP